MVKSESSQLVMIRKTDEFSSVFSFRRRYTTANLVIHVRPNVQAQVRVGFIVAKKVAKLAVDRNYMRRVLRELCREELHVLKNVDIVVQVRQPFKKPHFSLLRQELSSLFVKIQAKIAQEK